MAQYTKLLSVTLADTNWHSYGSASTGMLNMGPRMFSRTNDRLLTIHKQSVATNACSLCFGDRPGNTDGGTRGMIFIPDPTPTGAADKLAGCVLTFGNASFSFTNSGVASAGTVIDLVGKTHAQVVTEAVALITAGTTGIGDLEVVDGVEPGVIALQSDASSVVAPSWSLSAKAAGGGLVPRPYADGMAAAGAIVLPTTALIVMDHTIAPFEDVRVVSLRANTANSVVVLELVFEEANPAIR